ncbi:DUF2971 domain-containing protein [Chromobacterium sphagni]|uniref:DUF2971 domain-containing protein n=1 Tax=Chromobacterium sphagni TaxID=1903179 RepID=UPI0019D3D84F|nr:DUF2971 domain-containing protein [Chromobacterium sphagni]
MTKPIPSVLYKYRDFSARTVAMLCNDELFYADPSTFNDPLDAKPCVEADCDIPTLEKTVLELVRRRVEAEMQAGAQTLKYKGPKTLAHIDKHSTTAAQRRLQNLAYHATNPEYADAGPNAHARLLADEIEQELLLQYDKGILSLAKRYACPLMWSHYGDQHRGLCIGYRVPQAAQSQLHQVKYGGSRNVQASTVAAMLSGDTDARAIVDSTVLLRKAQAWRYEKEWRMLGPHGKHDSPLELAEVIFGMRCEDTVKHTIARALDRRDKPIKLYEIHKVPGTFQLKRRRLNVDELGASYPKRALSVAEACEPVTPSSE